MTFGSCSPAGWESTSCRVRGAEQLALFVGGKLVFCSLAFAVPLLFHPLWVVAAVYALTAVGNGCRAGRGLSARALRGGRRLPARRFAGRIDNAWAVHQVETTVDFARGSAAAWLLGGLNFQIEHHLFSRICHVNYPAIAAVVEADLRGIRRALQPQHDRARGAAIALSLVAPYGCDGLDRGGSSGVV